MLNIRFSRRRILSIISTNPDYSSGCGKDFFNSPDPFRVLNRIFNTSNTLNTLEIMKKVLMGALILLALSMSVVSCKGCADKAADASEEAGAAMEEAGEAAEEAMEEAGEATESAVEAAGEAAADAVDAAQEAGEKAVEAAEGAAESAKQAGEDAMNQVKKAADDVKEAVKDSIN